MAALASRALQRGQAALGQLRSNSACPLRAPSRRSHEQHHFSKAVIRARRSKRLGRVDSRHSPRIIQIDAQTILIVAAQRRSR